METYIYLSLPGATGDVKDRNYRGWIELTGASYGTRNRAGGGQSRGSAGPSEVYLSTGQGAAAIAIFRFAATGKDLPLVRVVFVQKEGASSKVYAELELKGAIVSSAQMGSQGDLSFTLNSEKITVTYRR